MTPREIVLANIEHACPPRPGFTFSGGRRNDFHGGGFGRPAGYRKRRWQEGNREYYDDPWGNLWVRMVGGSAKGEVHTPALTDWSQLDDLVPPDYTTEESLGPLRKALSEPTDKFRNVGMGGWVFADARYLRRMDQYFVDMVAHPDELKRLHEIIARVYEGKIRVAGECGADGIMFAEDLGTQQGLLFSPAMWRDYFKDLYGGLFGLAHDYGMKVLMHSCGQNREILPDLLDAGVDVFQFDQPAIYDMDDLAELLRRRKAALWAPLDIQKHLPTGDRDLIEREARRLVETFGGGLILTNYPDLPGIGVAPEWDQWAYEAFCDAAGIDP
ncbi:MAG: uroporphyrinogen decarboxylase family protein [Planctomycetota bacterium]